VLSPLTHRDAGSQIIRHVREQENGFEIFIVKLADELLEREVFDTLYEANLLVEHWWSIAPPSSVCIAGPSSTRLGGVVR